MPDDADRPVFLPRKGVLMREYHVLVRWPDGRRMKVGRFPCRPDAARWIAHKSVDWLAAQTASDEDESAVQASQPSSERARNLGGQD